MKQIKNILIHCLLLATFVVPQAIQYHHVLTVHHYVSHCDSHCSQGKHFHKATEHCPIHEFTFNLPAQLGHKIIVQQPTVYSETIETAYQQPKIQFSVYHYFLRGPPHSSV